MFLTCFLTVHSPLFSTWLARALKKHLVLEKSLKTEKLWDILKKSLNFPQKSLNIFESSLNKNNPR